MHQIQVSAPQGKGEEVARVALKSGIQQASVQTAYVHGPNQEKDVVTVMVETPTAKKFVDALMTASFFNPQDYEIASQQMPAIISSEKPAKLTHPFDMPSPDVYEDMWLQNHINPSYLARAFVSALLLAYGMIQNDLITMIAALLFTPFLPQVLGAGFGIVTRQWRLVGQGLMVLGISTAITVISGVIVASIAGGPLQYNTFNSILVNFLISLIVGIAAGYATADIAGRRELIAIAAAAQFSIYPAWFGIMLVLGLPGAAVVSQRLLTYLVNVVTILVVSTLVYLTLRYKSEVIERYSKAVRS